MRSITSSYISGPEAIAVAAILWWASMPESRKAVLAWVRRLPKEAFCYDSKGEIPRRTKSGLGRHVVTLWPDLPRIVWDEVRKDPGVRFMLDLGTSDDEDDMEEFGVLVGTACAEIILEAGEFTRFEKPIRRYRMSKKPPRPSRRGERRYSDEKP